MAESNEPGNLTLDQYNYYFERCETANRTPLSFDEWLKTEQDKNQ